MKGKCKRKKQPCFCRWGLEEMCMQVGHDREWGGMLKLGVLVCEKCWREVVCHDYFAHFFSYLLVRFRWLFINWSTRTINRSPTLVPPSIFKRPLHAVSSWKNRRVASQPLGHEIQLNQLVSRNVEVVEHVSRSLYQPDNHWASSGITMILKTYQ